MTSDRENYGFIHRLHQTMGTYNESYTYYMYLQGTLSKISSMDSISQKCSKVAPETYMYHTGKEKFYTPIQLHAQR